MDRKRKWKSRKTLSLSLSHIPLPSLVSLLHLLWHHLMIRRKVARVVKVTGSVYSPFFWCHRQTFKFTSVSQVGFPVENWSGVGVRHDFEKEKKVISSDGEKHWISLTHPSYELLFFTPEVCVRNPLHMNRYPNLRCIPYSYRNNFPQEPERNESKKALGNVECDIPFTWFNERRISLVRFAFPLFPILCNIPNRGVSPSLPHEWLDWDCLIKFFSFPLFTPSRSLPVKRDSVKRLENRQRTLFSTENGKGVPSVCSPPSSSHLRGDALIQSSPLFLFVYSSSISVSMCQKVESLTNGRKT